MKMRKRYPVIVLLLFVAAIAVSASLVVADASATPDYAACSPCHGVAVIHPAHAVDVAGDPATCTPCHGGGGPAPSNCASCHGAGAIVAGHPTGGCADSVDCHGAPSPSPTPTATDTPTPTPSATDDGGGGVGGVDDDDADDVGFPATGYAPSDGGSTPWLLITGAFAAGLTLLFAVWRIPAARRRD